MAGSVDRSERRDWNVQRSFRRFVYPAIAAYFVITFVAVNVLTADPVAQFYALFPIGLLTGIVLLGLATKTQKRQMAEAHAGYNVQDGSKPFFLFGKREYTRYRVDTGSLQGMTAGYSPYKDKLDRIEQEQREMQCEVCADEIGWDGGYFVETRALYRVFGIPIREKILETDAYCGAHKPRDFQ